MTTFNDQLQRILDRQTELAKSQDADADLAATTNGMSQWDRGFLRGSALGRRAVINEIRDLITVSTDEDGEN